MGNLCVCSEELGKGLMEFGSALGKLEMRLEMMTCIQWINFFHNQYHRHCTSQGPGEGGGRGVKGFRVLDFLVLACTKKSGGGCCFLWGFEGELALVSVLGFYSAFCFRILVFCVSKLGVKKIGVLWGQATFVPQEFC